MADEEQLIPENPEEPPQFTKKPLAGRPKKRAPRQRKTAPAESANSSLPARAAEMRVEKKLMEIYENTDGSMPDMKHIEKRKRRRAVKAFFSLLLACAFLGAVAWTGFFILQPRSAFSEDDIVLNVSGPEEIQLGESVTYRIRYRNAQAVPLHNVTLEVRYPEGFIFGSSSVSSTDAGGDAWDLTSLTGDEEGSIEVTGRLFGSLHESQSLRVFFNYTPENFSSEFQKVAALTTKIETTPLAFSIEGKNVISSGSAAAFTLALSPPAEQSLSNLMVEFAPGERFSKKQSTPAPDTGEEYRWSIPLLSKEEKITISGVMLSEADEETVTLTARVRGWKDAARSSEGYVYAIAEFPVTIRKTAVAATLAVNGSVEGGPLYPGDTMNASVTVKNSGTTPKKNVRVRAVFDAPSYNRQSILKWAELDDPADGTVAGEQLSAEYRRGSITWTSAQIAEFRELAPGEEVTIDFHLPVKDADDADLSDFATAAVTASTEVSYTEGAAEEKINSNVMTLTLLSNLSFEVTDEVGVAASGKEFHTIAWVINNSFHELENVRTTADVYGDVTIDEAAIDAPAGAVVYDKEKKTLTWTIDRLPTTLDVVALQIPIVVNTKNPTQTNLTSTVTLRAIDTVAKQEMLKVGEGIRLQ